jgi:glycosyltransferase involved in cell wall biosynthesis
LRKINASLASKKQEVSGYFIWHPSLDYHQYYTWLVFRSIAQKTVSFVLGGSETKIRKAQGWSKVDLDLLSPIFVPPENLWKDGMRLLRENSNAVHVFQSFRGGEGYNYFPLILYALRKGIKVVVMDEAYSTSPVGIFQDENIFLSHFKNWVRPRLRHFYAKSISAASKSQKPCIAPLSLMAKRQFIKDGFDPETLVPFGYFVPKQQIVKNNTPSDSLRLVYLGSLIHRKGIDILTKAVRELHEQGYKIELDMYGSGDPQKVGLPNIPIQHKGILPFDRVQAVIAEYDILVLPSRHDGWGVVVNEALLQGVPVILSSRVGAKCLVESTGAGLIFESENIGDFVEKMKMLFENPLILQELRENAGKVGKEILPEMAARYFLDSITFYFSKIGAQPSAIWSIDCPESDFG